MCEYAQPISENIKGACWRRTSLGSKFVQRRSVISTRQSSTVAPFLRSAGEMASMNSNCTECADALEAKASLLGESFRDMQNVVMFETVAIHYVSANNAPNRHFPYGWRPQTTVSDHLTQ